MNDVMNDVRNGSVEETYPGPIVNNRSAQVIYDNIKEEKKVADSFDYWQTSVNAKRIICPISKEEVGLHSKYDSYKFRCYG